MIILFRSPVLPKRPLGQFSQWARFGFPTQGVGMTITLPPLVTVKIPLQENLTIDMLGSVSQDPNFYTDPGLNQQVLTNINYPWGELYTVGWTPIGMNIYVKGVPLTKIQSIFGVRPYG